MPASVWSGYLTFGLISMPVRLYSGARGTSISFNMLHREDLSRVKQQLICSADNQVLDRRDIVKGYEYRKGEYVVIEPEEIKKIEPKTAKAMEIVQFVKASEIDPLYLESSYYMTPEEGGKRPYALLSRAMADNNYYAIAKLTMHNREYTVCSASLPRRPDAAHDVLPGRGARHGKLRDRGRRDPRGRAEDCQSTHRGLGR